MDLVGITEYTTYAERATCNRREGSQPALLFSVPRRLYLSICQQC